MQVSIEFMDVQMKLCVDILYSFQEQERGLAATVSSLNQREMGLQQRLSKLGGR